MKTNYFDIAIIGGGLAGLALSIEQARAGRKVLLFEKKSYPYHKVCGEYISNESRTYLEKLGIPLNQLGVTNISQLTVTTRDTQFNHTLSLGGFGISRNVLDYELAKIAKQSGVTLIENTTISNYIKKK